MNDYRPQTHDDVPQPGEPQGGWYANGGADQQYGQGWEAPGGATQYGSAQYGSGQYGSGQYDTGKHGDSGSRTALIGGIALVAGLLLGGALGFVGGSSSSTEAAPTTVTETASETTTVESTVEVTAPPAEEPEGGDEPGSAGAMIPGDGTYLVGTDIEPGTYRAAGADSCYWARLSGTTGDLDEIIVNDFGSGQMVVTIAESDVAFETARCGTWEKVS